MSDQLLRFLGEVVAYGGGGAVVAYLLFQFLGKKWIENRFSQNLEQYKHQQALEMQRLRVEIDSMLSGVIELQRKEFETLPEAWRKLDEAFGRVSALTSPGQSYPNLNGMSLARLNEFLESSELFKTQQDEIRESTNKLNAYQEAIFWHRLHTVKQACADFHNYVARYGIFFPIEIKNKFARISEELWSAVSSKAIGHEAKDYKLQSEGWTKIKDDIEPLYNEIEADIHTRLHSHGHSK